MNRTALSFVLASTTLTTACSIDTSFVYTAGAGAGTTTTATGGGSGGGTQTTGSAGSTGGTGASGGTGGTGAGGATGGTGGSGASGGTGGVGGSTGTTMPGCNGGPNDDLDKDGFTPVMGDCNDCDPLVSPDAIEIVGNALDDNCDGKQDEKLATCDDNVGLDSQNPGDMPHVFDLCKLSSNVNDWGVISSVWALPDGTPPPANQMQNFHLGHGALTDFGPNVKPRAGKKILALSSGTARRPSDGGFQNLQGFSKGITSGPPPGYPKESASCPGVKSGTPNDAAGLSLLIRAPSNVHGFSYDFSFYAYDFPDNVCSVYDDFFYAVMNPPPAGQAEGNIALDEMGSPVSLNGANFRVCGCMNGPCKNQAGNKQFACPLGTMQLVGTGFDAGGGGQQYRGATGWLTTTVPVKPGDQIGLILGVYDGQDQVFDSTVLLDNWQWITTPGVTLGTKVAQ